MYALFILDDDTHIVSSPNKSVVGVSEIRKSLHTRLVEMSHFERHGAVRVLKAANLWNDGQKHRHTERIPKTCTALTHLQSPKAPKPKPSNDIKSERPSACPRTAPPAPLDVLCIPSA